MDAQLLRLLAEMEQLLTDIKQELTALEEITRMLAKLMGQH